MSLRWKLVALYALILAGVIGGICAVMPMALRHQLVQAVDAELQARARAVGAFTEREHSVWTIEATSGVAAEFATERGLYYVVRDLPGAVLLVSPLAKALGFGGPSAALAAEPRERGAAGHTFRELTVTVTRSADEEEPELRGLQLSVTCGKDLREVEFSVDSLVRQLLLLGPLVLLLSLSGGWLLVSRALRPIEEMAATAAAIGGSDLARRLPVRGQDELARLGRTLNGTFDRLQDAIERQRRFTADASHELRTPLAAVVGHADLALRRPRSAEEYRGALGAIQAGAQRMHEVVERLLTLARADAGALDLRREPVALAALCAEVLRAHRPLAAERQVALHLDSPESDEVLQVAGDPDRLRELVGNLVANAIRYNRSEGSVRLRLTTQDDRVVLEVHDTGIGIPAEHLPQVFERFYRVAPDRTRGPGGSGLGLAIAQQIARAHGGAIEVASQPGRGSVFTVTLPAGSGVAAAVHGASDETRAGTPASR